MVHSTDYRPTRAIINLQAIEQNIRQLKAYLEKETEIIAVVKADGYGHGEVEVAETAFAAGAKMVSVATPDEAIRLRERGITGDILVMGPSPVSFAVEAAKRHISLTVFELEWLQQAEKLFLGEQQLKIHLKVDSGMGRIGLRNANILQAIDSYVQQSKHFILEGIFTHFACADEENPARTEEQFAVFQALVHQLRQKPRYVHASNSAATLLYPQYHLDAVRFGISLYGIAPSSYVGSKLPFKLQRAFQLETELAYVKQLSTGEPISYGGTYTTVTEEWIGTLPIGYADGLQRGLRGQEVLIDGQRVPIVGTICMDQCMVKLPKELSVGTKVVLLGKQGEEEITMEEWAKKLGTIPYEIAVSIMKRVPRIYSGKKG